jgi:hypothetical protein
VCPLESIPVTVPEVILPEASRVTLIEEFWAVTLASVGGEISMVLPVLVVVVVISLD